MAAFGGGQRTAGFNSPTGVKTKLQAQLYFNRKRKRQQRILAQEGVYASPEGTVYVDPDAGDIYTDPDSP